MKTDKRSLIAAKGECIDKSDRRPLSRTGNDITNIALNINVIRKVVKSKFLEHR